MKLLTNTKNEVKMKFADINSTTHIDFNLEKNIKTLNSKVWL